MISDFVKGNKKFEYDAAIQKGITLHRLIDEYTDKHEATKRAKVFFKPAVGLYAGAFVDVMYDHFLASDTNEFSDDSLQAFAINTYSILQKNKTILPEKLGRMLPYMQEQNWLYNYRNLYGAEKSFEGLVRRAAYLQRSEGAYTCFIKNYQQLKQYYVSFFPDVKDFAYQNFLRLTSSSE